jgi:mannose-6-phosphate isomerase-like protein (cupin superfamily)
MRAAARKVIEHCESSLERVRQASSLGHGIDLYLAWVRAGAEVLSFPSACFLQVIANIYDVPAGATVPRHFHHGDEFHLVLSGEWAAEVEGKPEHSMKVGDSQYVEREHWHGGKVAGTTPMKLLGPMIVEKDKPITEIVGR